ncbi:cytochrome b/b6 domain-containing protein [Amnibacterium kyonggiense]
MSAGSAPPVRRRWPWLLAGAVVLAVAVVVVARVLRFSEAGESFVTTWTGAAPQPRGVAEGFPAWAAWQHGLNAVFLLFTVRSGWRIHRAGRPSTFWTRRNDGRIRTANPPVRIAIDLWSHFVADTLWVLNGVLFVVLCGISGHWARIVPTAWSVVPQALSAGLQYASFAWPTEDGWVDYNALQQLSYFVVVYIAGPVAVLTGLRAAPGFAARLRFLDARFPLRTAKAIHWWTMWFFVAFTAVHVFLVLATGAIRNLNHVYAVRDDESPAGLIVFAVSLLLTAALVVALRPPVVRWAAARTGTVLHRPPRPPRPR